MPSFFFNDTATTEIYPLSLHDALPISRLADLGVNTIGAFSEPERFPGSIAYTVRLALSEHAPAVPGVPPALVARITRDYFDPAFEAGDRKSTPLNSRHLSNSHAVFFF